MCLVLVIGLLVVLAVGMRPLERLAGAQAGQKPVAVHIRWPMVRPTPGAEPVTWVPEAQRVLLLDRAKGALRQADGDRWGDGLRRVGVSLGESGWFHGNPTVRRDKGNTIVIDGRWRVPAAVVRRAGTDQLISWEGVPMPLTQPSGRARFPVIEGPAMPPPMQADGTVDCSQAWAGEDVSASLELLQVALRQPWGGQIAGVDATRFAEDRVLVLTTTFGTRVVWGGRVSKPALGEVSSSQKLAHMGELFEKHRRIDAGFPMIYVNSTKMQFDISATAQALAAVQQPQAEQGGR